MCAMISGLFIGSNDGRPPQAYKENIVSLKRSNICLSSWSAETVNIMSSKFVDLYGVNVSSKRNFLLF